MGGVRGVGLKQYNLVPATGVFSVAGKEVCNWWKVVVAYHRVYD